jgi:hypothetical protein
MGLRAMAWAFLTARPSTERFVLVALAEHADEDGVCWPGVSRLTERTGYGRATVQRALARLEVDGLLSRQERCVSGGRQTSNLYVLDLGWQPPAAVVAAEDRGACPENAGPHSGDFLDLSVSQIRPGNAPEGAGGGLHSAAP